MSRHHVFDARFLAVLLFATTTHAVPAEAAPALPVLAVVDDVDDIMKAAREAIAGLTAQQASLNDQINLAVTQALKRVDATIPVRGESNILEQLTGLDQLNAKINELTQKKTESDDAKELFEQALRILRDAQARLAELAAKMKAFEAAQAALATFLANRERATQLTELLRRNDRSGVTALLRRDQTDATVEVIDIPTTTGLVLVVRINGLAHCLSTKLQCGGKAWSLR